MTRVQRQALFQEGLTGLLGAVPRSQTDGLWSLFHELDTQRDLAKVHQHGTLPTTRIFGLVDFLGPAKGLSRDGQIGSIGGGNHFVEIQRVARIIDGSTAHAWGLKEGLVTIMVHSGSLSIGHHCGSHFRDVLREIFPSNLRYPANGIFLLPEGERHQKVLDLFWAAMNNAANFAFANRLFLTLMAVQSLRESCGRFDVSILYDAPHNLVWRAEMDAQPIYLHRKGACPAGGFDAMQDTAFAYYGEPVLVPGSMGASSFVLAGRGNPEALWSASHGAGRAMSRGDALHGSDEAFQAFLKAFRVVTPVDLRRPDIQMRRDIVEKKLEDIKKEAPFAYKGIGPVVNTLTQAGIAQPVAELTPLMTIKG
jgi:tRNA-splicing ligase RtcB